jgi:DNA invertase Pin-like site-specific DNA recombinase
MATVSGDLDLSTHEGQLMARITGAVARKESDDKSRRIQRKHQELAHACRVRPSRFCRALFATPRSPAQAYRSTTTAA